MSIALDAAELEPGLQADQRRVDKGWLKIGIGLAVAGQAMVFSFAINLSEITGWAYVVVHGTLIFAALATLAFLGGDLVGSAWDSVRARRMSIDLLFLVTLLGALGGSLVSTFTHTGSVYYEVVAILIVVHTGGKMLGARSRLAALRAVDKTREKFEWCEVILPSGLAELRSARVVAAGERIRVAPGAPIAVDGKIVSGRGYVQETSMTGEWKPVQRSVGDFVLAGTYSMDGTFEIAANGGIRRLDTILMEIERARLKPSRLQAQADRLMIWFLPVVVAASLLTFAIWSLYAPWQQALFNAMAVLLVACPCAMGLATPLAIWSGLARLADFGVLARTGDVLEVLATAEVVCLDKTGTLSSERLTIRSWELEPSFRHRWEWLSELVRTAEEGLPHPIARALSTRQVGLVHALHSRRIVPGLGVVAEVSTGDGEFVEVRVGERALGTGQEDDDKLAADGSKRVWIFVGDTLAATVTLEERWRVGLCETLIELGKLGITVQILSGDPRAAEALQCILTATNETKAAKSDIASSAAGIAVFGGLSPMEKKSKVDALTAAGKIVLFTGDGVNDAPAMSAAQGAIAMGAGADLARASASAVYVGEDFQFLARAVRVARAVQRSIRVNLLFAAAYNLVGVVLAAGGWLHPVVAALLMVGSSLAVSITALRGTAGAVLPALQEEER